MLQGKVAVVTGGTRGIGLAVVRKFLANGASVVLFGSRKESADAAVAALKAENPDYGVAGLWPDLSDAGAVREAFETVRSELGSPDILVNNAGIAASDPLYTYQPEVFAKIMDLNVYAVFLCSQAAASS